MPVVVRVIAGSAAAEPHLGGVTGCNWVKETLGLDISGVHNGRLGCEPY
jgi:hypothetical protein